MENLSKARREQMVRFLETLKAEHDDDASLMAIHAIERELTAKRYGLIWEEHEETVDVMMRESIPVFTEVAAREIREAPGSPCHFLLEGDNLHSLYLLEKVCRERVRMIYIDPPYNTGNQDFVYDDAFVDDTDGYRHSKWISFMEKRLQIAKRLLAAEGVLFISIDDNEMAQLKLLCDEIFGERNFAANIIVKSNPRGSQSRKEIASVNEYILVYAKDIDRCAIIGHALSEDMASEYKYADDRGRYRLLGLRQRGGFWRASERPNLFYPFYINVLDASISLQADESHTVAVYPFQPTTGEKGTWRWSREKAEKEMEDLVARPVRRRNQTEWDLFQKDYLVSGQSARRTKAKSLWEEKELNYQNAANELKNIFVTSPFTYAKPVYLVMRAMEMIGFSDGDIVLDFFAGSGTTAQAVLEQNRADGIQRRFILCTNNENQICENITYQRVRAVITGRRMDGALYSEGIPANLKYYRTDFISKTEEDLTGALLAHAVEMIQLEHGLEPDARSSVLLMSEEEADALERNWAQCLTPRVIYVANHVLLTAAQEMLFATAEIRIIPDCYFHHELRELGELW